MLHHDHDLRIVFLSIVLAMFASYTALDLASSITSARGRARAAWLAGGAVAMGVGIWSMHFVGMLAFRVEQLPIRYQLQELILSVLVAIAGSAAGLFVVSRSRMSALAFVAGSVAMGAAICGMHYIGIAGMSMAAEIVWDRRLVAASIFISVAASFVALSLAFRLRRDVTRRGFGSRLAAGVVMGAAISGMHYTAMAAMDLVPAEPVAGDPDSLLVATAGLALAVLGSAALLLAVALTGSIVERALARREAAALLLTRILESIIDGFYSVARDWRFTYVNPVAVELFRSSGHEGELIGREMWEALPELRGTRLEATLRRAMASGRPAHVEEYFPPLQRWFEARAYPSPDGLSCYFRDITARKRNEQALEAAVQARDQFLSIASHELKTPLTTMKLQVQSQLRRLDRDGSAVEEPRLRRMLETESRQINRLVRLVDDMLDIARINTGRLEIHREQVELQELVADVLERQADQLEAAGCSVTFERGPPIHGRWDRFRLEQVLANLLTNAMRYGNGRPIHIEAGVEGGFARLSVRDHGIGIEPEDRERIFEQFERAVPATTVSGLGLGLYIVRQIVELHGGRVTVESEPGSGSTFIVLLPLGDGAGADPAASAPPP